MGSQQLGQLWSLALPWPLYHHFPLSHLLFIYYLFGLFGHFLVGSNSKESACYAENLGLIPESGRFPWRREWQPTPVFLSGEFHLQRSLVTPLSE